MAPKIQDQQLEENSQEGHGRVTNSLSFDEESPESSTTTLSSRVGYRLDPGNWDEYRAQMHKLLDQCCDHMESYRTLPWKPPPEDFSEQISLGTRSMREGRPLSSVMDQMVQDIMPHATGNTHPQFMGWVHGAGIPSCIAADLVSSTMNSNCGGRHHGAPEIEKACIELLCEIAGFKEKTDGNSEPFGVLTNGTSQATIFALLAARTRKFGQAVRRSGIRELPHVRIYVSNAAHSCLSRAMECLGHGSDSVVRVPIDPDSGSMQVGALAEMVEQDKALGIEPLAIVGTAGSVTVGAYDNFEALAKLAAEHEAWFHIDAAFGFWTCLSNDPTTRRLTKGLHLADSIALDAHKWPGVNYDCGVLLVQDKEHLRQTLAMRPAYLQSAQQGLAGGDLWFTDYSLDLSRGFRALKLWTALTVAGTDEIGAVITDHCHLASRMARLVNASPVFELAHPVISNVCCFYINPRLTEGPVPEATEIAAQLQLDGNGVFSTVKLGNFECLRAAIVNHRTTPEDIDKMIIAAERAVITRMKMRENPDSENLPDGGSDCSC